MIKIKTIKENVKHLMKEILILLVNGPYISLNVKLMIYMKNK